MDNDDIFIIAGVSSNGTVTANRFVGDGSGLTNIDFSDVDSAINIKAGSGITLQNSGSISTINVANELNISGTITANRFVGDGSGLTNIPAGVISILEDSVSNIEMDNDDIFIIAGVSSNGTVTANRFVGDGAQLTNLPDATGIVDSVIINDNVHSEAAIAFTKLANLIGGNILVGNGLNKATSVTLSGDATLTNSGAITIANNVINNAKINNTDSFLFENLSVNSTVSASMVMANTIFTTSISGDQNASGIPANDSFRLRYENDFFGSNLDALIIEKTDGDADDPDGSIVFTNTGNDGVVSTAMVIRGNGNVGIGTNTPSETLEVDGNVEVNGSIKYTKNTNWSNDNSGPSFRRWPEPDFDSGWITILSQAGPNSFKQLPHPLGQYPSFVKVLIKSNSAEPSDYTGDNAYIFEAGGVNTTDDESDHYGGLVYGYNKDNIRIWVPDQHDQSSNGRVINIFDGWGGEQNNVIIQDASIRILMWR